MARFSTDDVEAALKAIGNEEPKPFEGKWPISAAIVKECERQEKLRNNTMSPVKDCRNRDCKQGMVRVFDATGYPTGVVACGLCGGPSWMAAAIDSNKWLLKEKGLL